MSRDIKFRVWDTLAKTFFYPDEGYQGITPELEADANAFLIARTYIQVGQTYRDVGPDMAERILAAPRAFIEAVQARASA